MPLFTSGIFIGMVELKKTLQMKSLGGAYRPESFRENR
jgi:hypothetical protein